MPNTRTECLSVCAFEATDVMDPMTVVQVPARQQLTHQVELSAGVANRERMLATAAEHDSRLSFANDLRRSFLFTFPGSELHARLQHSRRNTLTSSLGSPSGRQRDEFGLGVIVALFCCVQSRARHGSLIHPGTRRAAI